MYNLDFFRNKKMVATETVGFSFEHTSSNQYSLSEAFVVIDNSEMFHNTRMVVAESVDFRFEADLFKSGPMILCFGCHLQR